MVLEMNLIQPLIGIRTFCFRDICRRFLLDGALRCDFGATSGSTWQDYRLVPG